jgi:RND superfamily putative drug exporter
MAFIFLVALGVDYTIFLMHSTREEARVHGTREGVLRALVSTGPVVTGAGIILAGTFATLTLIPLQELIQIGAAVALGVVLDTFVVRALLVPSITRLLGDRVWWPRRSRA